MTDDIPAWRKNGVKIVFDLSSGEKAWRNRQKMLERHGYLLRPRYRPEWVPSWLGTEEPPYEFEDGIICAVSPIRTLVALPSLTHW